MNKNELIDGLNHIDIKERLKSLSELKKMLDSDEIEKPDTGKDVNNHIHTTYSFSPYSPTKAVWRAYISGLETAGIIDHDSIGGAKEFIEAGSILNIATTIGFECRASMKNTALEGRKLNHPDQKDLAYMCIHGVPHDRIDEVQEYLKPYRELRNKRNEKMVDNINKTIGIDEISLDFHKDIVSISEYKDGGSITERHILFALALKIVDLFGKGNETIDFLQSKLGLDIRGKMLDYLSDIGNDFYTYDLLGLLKSSLVEKIYINADEECPPIKELLEFSNSIGAISSYAYLGDVKGSVTGDKKDQKFEDDYIILLFDTLKELGFNAISYMPARNTKEQLDRIRKLCDKYGLFQISGEDINSPRQSFICMAQRAPEFKNLYDATWALIGHEKAATENIKNGMFAEDTIEKLPELSDRVNYFKNLLRTNRW
jgi:hypothetical protein